MKIKNQTSQLISIIFIFLFSNSVYSQYLTSRYVDKDQGYSIMYPKGWQAGEYRSGIVLSEINSKDGQSGLQIRKIPFERRY